MTRFSNFTDEELNVMESAFCNEGLIRLVEEVRLERQIRQQNKYKNYQ
jgi:hypothetical protein